MSGNMLLCFDGYREHPILSTMLRELPWPPHLQMSMKATEAKLQAYERQMGDGGQA